MVRSTRSEATATRNRGVRLLKVAARTHWIAFEYEPNGLGGLPLGHLASSVTVFEDKEEAQKRLFVERSPGYAAPCCAGTAASGTTGTRPQAAGGAHREAPAGKLPNETAFAWRYTAIVEIEGEVFPVYTDHIVFTQDRVRVWTRGQLRARPLSTRSAVATCSSPDWPRARRRRPEVSGDAARQRIRIR